MTLVLKTGDLFSSEASAIGHGVNCKGLMGAGIAVQFRSLYPDMYQEYRKLCMEDLLRPGQIFPYRAHDRTVINIASQEYPGPDAKYEWLITGVRAALRYCEERGLASLALPRIGCGIGGLEWVSVELLLGDITDEHPTIELEVWSL